MGLLRVLIYAELLSLLLVPWALLGTTLVLRALGRGPFSRKK